jgi:hypothetical protein
LTTIVLVDGTSERGSFAVFAARADLRTVNAAFVRIIKGVDARAARKAAIEQVAAELGGRVEAITAESLWYEAAR